MASYDSEPDPRTQIIHMKQIQAEGLVRTFYLLNFIRKI
jgi:hypothetical protein